MTQRVPEPREPGKANHITAVIAFVAATAGVSVLFAYAGYAQLSLFWQVVFAVFTLNVGALAGGLAGYGFLMAENEQVKETNRYIDAGFTPEQANALVMDRTLR